MKMDSKLLLLLVALLFSALVSAEVSDSDPAENLGNPLQKLLSSFECYGTEQEGCNEDFIEAYPDLSRGYNNRGLALTHFFLFTPKNPDQPEILDKCGGNLPARTNFNPKCKTLIVFPGFASGICHMAVYKEIKNQRLKCGCWNYIHVEWTWGNSFDLVTAVNNSKVVVNQTAVVINGIKKKFGLTADDFMCFGHSIGAHMCGLLGQRTKIGSIYGSDPAGGPYAQDTPLDERLDSGDAPCVIGTHCNAGQCIPFFFGANYTVGTKDLFYNDGIHQPACIKQLFISLLKGDIIYALISLIPAACNHLQCLEYFKTSICSPDCKWIGVECNSAKDFLLGKCNDCGPSGEKCDQFKMDSCECNKGDFKSYYTKAKISCPYCVDKGIKNIDKVGCSF